MTNAIPPSGQAYTFQQQESPQERQKLFEIQFETAVLGIFVSVSQANNDPIQRQISQLKNGIATNQPPDQLASSLNQIISQINQTLPPGTAPFPPFYLTSEGSQVQAISYQAISLEKCLLTLSQKGHLNPQKEQQLFSDLANFIGNVAQMPPQAAYEKLNALIGEVNQNLSAAFQLPQLS